MSMSMEPVQLLHAGRPEEELQQRTYSLREHRVKERQGGWIQNDTYGVVSACQAFRSTSSLPDIEWQDLTFYTW